MVGHTSKLLVAAACYITRIVAESRGEAFLIQCN